MRHFLNFHPTSCKAVFLKRIMVTNNKVETDNYIKSAKLEALFLKMACQDDEQAKRYFIECYETFYDRRRYGQFNIITSFLAGDTLMERYIKKKKSPSIKTSVNLIKQFFKALMFLKEKTLVHTDIKPENIVFWHPQYKKDGLTKWDPEDKIKIIDFGGATPDDPEAFNKDRRLNPSKEHCPRKTRTICTAEYRPPEVVLEYEWSYPVDVWSFGCMLYELIARRCLFPPGLDDDECYNKLYKSKDIHFQTIKDCEGDTCYENRIGVIAMKRRMLRIMEKIYIKNRSDNHGFNNLVVKDNRYISSREKTDMKTGEKYPVKIVKWTFLESDTVVDTAWIFEHHIASDDKYLNNIKFSEKYQDLNQKDHDKYFKIMKIIENCLILNPEFRARPEDLLQNVDELEQMLKMDQMQREELDFVAQGVKVESKALMAEAEGETGLEEGKDGDGMAASGKKKKLNFAATNIVYDIDTAAKRPKIDKNLVQFTKKGEKINPLRLAEDLEEEVDDEDLLGPQRQDLLELAIKNKADEETIIALKKKEIVREAIIENATQDRVPKTQLKGSAKPMLAETLENFKTKTRFPNQRMPDKSTLDNLPGPQKLSSEELEKRKFKGKNYIAYEDQEIAYPEGYEAESKSKSAGLMKFRQEMLEKGEYEIDDTEIYQKNINPLDVMYSDSEEEMVDEGKYDLEQPSAVEGQAAETKTEEVGEAAEEVRDAIQLPDGRKVEDLQPVEVAEAGIATKVVEEEGEEKLTHLTVQDLLEPAEDLPMAELEDEEEKEPVDLLPKPDLDMTISRQKIPVPENSKIFDYYERPASPTNIRKYHEPKQVDAKVLQELEQRPASPINLGPWNNWSKVPQPENILENPDVDKENLNKYKKGGLAEELQQSAAQYKAMAIRAMQEKEAVSTMQERLEHNLQAIEDETLKKPAVITEAKSKDQKVDTSQDTSVIPTVIPPEPPAPPQIEEVIEKIELTEMQKTYEYEQIREPEKEPEEADIIGPEQLTEDTADSASQLRKTVMDKARITKKPELKLSRAKAKKQVITKYNNESRIESFVATKNLLSRAELREKEKTVDLTEEDENIIGEIDLTNCFEADHEDVLTKIKRGPTKDYAKDNFLEMENGLPVLYPNLNSKISRTDIKTIRKELKEKERLKEEEENKKYKKRKFEEYEEGRINTWSLLTEEEQNYINEHGLDKIKINKNKSGKRFKNGQRIPAKTTKISLEEMKEIALKNLEALAEAPQVKKIKINQKIRNKLKYLNVPPEPSSINETEIRFYPALEDNINDRLIGLLLLGKFSCETFLEVTYWSWVLEKILIFLDIEFSKF